MPQGNESYISVGDEVTRHARSDSLTEVWIAIAEIISARRSGARVSSRNAGPTIDVR